MSTANNQTEAVRLNKAAILNGKTQIHYEYVEEWNGEVALAPLTEGQYSQVDSIKASGIKMKARPQMDSKGNPDFASMSESMEMEFDLEQVNQNDFEADALAVAYSLAGAGEHWTAEDVKSFRPPGIVAKLAKVVYKISGVTPLEVDQVQSFRGKSGGAGNNRIAPARSTAGKGSK